MQSIDIRYWLRGDILQKADKMSMAHSLEVRVPFLDRDVFETARQIPWKLKLKKHTTKYLLRKVAADYLPDVVSHKKKLGFPIPIRNWIKEEDWFGEIRAIFTGEAASRYFHTEYLVELLEEHKAGKKDNSRKIWTVYAFLIWHQVYFEA
ncbi:MAG: asparagine synthase C-terminal domain-containing protein, partial [Lachnospiraceae bacterium]|nr:asparagine synthase C-terminal domain-containing protein [Lachnospiraceae bacterium]